MCNICLNEYSCGVTVTWLPGSHDFQRMHWNMVECKQLMPDVPLFNLRMIQIEFSEWFKQGQMVFIRSSMDPYMPTLVMTDCSFLIWSCLLWFLLILQKLIVYTTTTWDHLYICPAIGDCYITMPCIKTTGLLFASCGPEVKTLPGSPGPWHNIERPPTTRPGPSHASDGLCGPGAVA